MLSRVLLLSSLALLPQPQLQLFYFLLHISMLQNISSMFFGFSGVQSIALRCVARRSSIAIALSRL